MASKKEDTIKISSSEITILPAEIEEKVNEEIGLIRVEANVTEELIKKLREEYGGLKIRDQSDKEGYLAVQEARKTVKKIRVAAGKLFDKGRQEAVAIADKWLDNKKKVIGDLSDIEDPLEEQEDAYEAEDKRIKADKARKLEEQGINRTSEMMSYGASLVDGNWVLGDLSYESILIKNADEDIYQGMRDQFKARFDVKEAARIQKEADDQAKSDQLLREQQEVAKAKEEAKKMRTEARISFLESLGMAKNGTHPSYLYADIVVPVYEIEEKEAQDWEVIIAGVKEGVETAKELARQAEKNREIFANRFLRLKEWSTHGQSVYSKGGRWGSTTDIIEMSDESFEKLVSDNDEYLKDKEDQKQREREKELEDARIEGIGKSRREMLKSVNTESGLSDFGLGSVFVDQWESDFKVATKLYEKKKKGDDDQKEKERVALLGEKAQYEELVAKLKAISVPVLKSGQYAGKANIIRNFIESLK